LQINADVAACEAVARRHLSGVQSLPRLVIVSNRVGIPDGKARAGGLEVAIRSALEQMDCLWFGWSGKLGPLAEPKILERKNVTYATIDLEQADFDEFYNGFANSVLWPVLHYRLDLIEFTRRDQSGYFRVNEYFAQRLAPLLRPDDVIWVQDYHFIPFAKALRDLGHRNRIGFFLHIPLPPPELLAALPNHEKLLSMLSYYDLVGFQTDRDAANFVSYFESECGATHSQHGGIVYEGREVAYGTFPVGIDVAGFSELAQKTGGSEFVKEVSESLGGRSLMIGIDRLDYSKGLPMRFDAYEMLLQKFPDWRQKVTYLQITPRSRDGVANYADIGRRINQSVSRINGTYGEVTWTPLRYVNRAHSHRQLAGLLKMSRVALVTPLRDGMNLVAKEFVAAQDADDPGVLVLSRFAGAAQELRDAILVNPYDTEGFAAAIDRALSMPLDERKARQKSLYQAVRASDQRGWAGKFLSRLNAPARNSGGVRVVAAT
jgi:trehalose 6-phosphate synthase